MGMFDEIKIEYKMPDSEIQNETFQTKSLENMMDNYTITEEGRLIFHKHHYEEVPEEERPYYGKPEWDESKTLFKFIGSMKSVHDEDIDMQYHGILEIHTMLGGFNSDDSEWFSYSLKFTDGTLINIERNE